MTKHCFLTPNPFKLDALSRCDAGILDRRYFVLEADIPPDGLLKKTDGSLVIGPWAPFLKDCSSWDLQAGIIFHLFELNYPIVSIVHSGGKSLHVWCSARGFSEEQILERIAYTEGLGVDYRGKVPSQFMRLPNPEHHGSGSDPVAREQRMCSGPRLSS
jgi:hypothetical protein